MMTNDDKQRRTKTKRLMFRTTEQTYDQLQRLASEQHRTLSSLLDYLIAQALKRREGTNDR